MRRYDADGMTRTLGMLLTLVLVSGCIFAMAAVNPVVGVWEVVSTGPEDMNWTLTVREVSGRLKGTLAGEVGEFELVDPRVEGDRFTFKLNVNDNTYLVETRISGNNLAGTYKGPDLSGTVKGTRQ
jgi:hypothetical protein